MDPAQHSATRETVCRPEGGSRERQRDHDRPTDLAILAILFSIIAFPELTRAIRLSIIAKLAVTRLVTAGPHHSSRAKSAPGFRGRRNRRVAHMCAGGWSK